MFINKVIDITIITIDKITAQWAFSSKFLNSEELDEIYCYKVKKINTKTVKKNQASINFGHIELTSKITFEKFDMSFVIFNTASGEYYCSVKKLNSQEEYSNDKSEITKVFMSQDLIETLKTIQKHISSEYYTLKDILIDKRKIILEKILISRLIKTEKAYQDLYDDMASNSYYQGYTENEIKTLLQDAYLNATGTTIVNDISANSNSSFEAGMESAVPIIGLLQNTNSADDFIAEATNTPVSGWSQVKAAAGVGTTSALSAAVAAAGVGVVSGAKSGGLLGILTGLKNAFTGKGATGKVAIAAGIVAAGASILTYIGSKLTNKD